MSSACYLPACSKRGKRTAPYTEVRRCMSCGPGNKGTCFGPHICCLREYGCYWSARCLDENLDPIPCEGSRFICNGNGRCGHTGVCCTDVTCFASTQC
ncbi:vasotocin-neurophysin VT-like [Pantherophis guttatus]|uniref:Vasotocin-neurophysin VT-like n=1 Tax=Pantherophis guttatus TaxID=94885 RepID=A0ABM3Z459_PANGU|nr:vasotocin-neurophysin VT-like [Pantherophis guttatus]